MHGHPVNNLYCRLLQTGNPIMIKVLNTKSSDGSLTCGCVVSLGRPACWGLQDTAVGTRSVLDEGPPGDAGWERASVPPRCATAEWRRKDPPGSRPAVRCSPLLPAYRQGYAYNSTQTRSTEQTIAEVTHQFAPTGPRARFSEGIDISAHRNLPPQTLLGVLRETFRMHHQHPVGGEAVHVAVRIFPLGCFLLVMRTPRQHFQTESTSVQYCYHTHP